MKELDSQSAENPEYTPKRVTHLYDEVGRELWTIAGAATRNNTMPSTIIRAIGRGFPINRYEYRRILLVSSEDVAAYLRRELTIPSSVSDSLSSESLHSSSEDLPQPLYLSPSENKTALFPVAAIATLHDISLSRLSELMRSSSYMVRSCWVGGYAFLSSEDVQQYRERTKRSRGRPRKDRAEDLKEFFEHLKHPY